MPAPKDNENAVKHGMFREKSKVRKSLSDAEEKMLVEIATDLLDRFPEGAEIGAYERASIEQVALDVIKRYRANDYILEHDLIDDSESTDRINKVYSRIMRDTTSELEKLGLLKEGPEMRKAEASEGWMEAVSEASNNADSGSE